MSDIIRSYKLIIVIRSHTLNNLNFLDMENNPTEGSGSNAVERKNNEENDGLFRMPSIVTKKKTGSVAKAFSEAELKDDVDQSLDGNARETPNDISGSSVSNQQSSEIAANKSKSKKFSPAERLKETESVIPYKEPEWSGLCEREYSFDIIKSGALIDHIDLSDKPYYVIGRLPSSDYTMDHPSLSRYHAVIQYCTQPPTSSQHVQRPGWYLYDLDSTHGTWINKNKVLPNVYYQLRVGYVVKFGGSSRLFILQVCLR